MARNISAIVDFLFDSLTWYNQIKISEKRFLFDTLLITIINTYIFLHKILNAFFLSLVLFILPSLFYLLLLINPQPHTSCWKKKPHLIRLETSLPSLINKIFATSYFTSNPSALKHILCFSMRSIHSGCSSPLKTTHSSRGFFVSGQQQQIGLPVLIPTFCGFFAGGAGGVDEKKPIFVS